MNEIWGWFGAAKPATTLDAMSRSARVGAEGLAGAELKRRQDDATAVLLHGSASAPGALVASAGCWMATLGHPRLRNGASDTSDPAALLERLSRSPAREGLADIGGDFAIAFWNENTRSGWIAVDRIGMRSMSYGVVDGALVFGSTLDAIAGFGGARPSLSEQAVFDYLFYHASPGPATILRDRHRVAPGHVVEFSEGSVAAPRRYWSLRFQEDAVRPLAQQKQQFLELLRQSVTDSAAGGETGSFLSGGTDSSTVSGMLARTGSRPARTFSIGFDVPGYDEMSYARIAATHFQCEHHEYYVTPDDVVAAVPRIAAFYDQPFGNASAIPTYYCARMARDHGVDRLLAGDGGDELFGGNDRYAKFQLLGYYDRVPRGLKQHLLEPLLLADTAVNRLPPLRKLGSYVRQAKPPMPGRYEGDNLLFTLGTGNVFEPQFLSAIDVHHPEQLLADAHAPFAGDSLINQMLAIDIRFVLGDVDLPKVARTCALAGVDVAFPLLDERLVEFSTHLASRDKLRGTKLRWFFKEALRDFLPPAILTKQKHGFGLPVGAWLTSHPPLTRLAVDSIATLRSRGIVKPAFVDELMHRRLAEHAPYFGTMVWILMMLALWLDARKM